MAHPELPNDFDVDKFCSNLDKFLGENKLDMETLFYALEAVFMSWTNDNTLVNSLYESCARGCATVGMDLYVSTK